MLSKIKQRFEQVLQSTQKKQETGVILSPNFHKDINQKRSQLVKNSELNIDDNAKLLTIQAELEKLVEVSDLQKAENAYLLESIEHPNLDPLIILEQINPELRPHIISKLNQLKYLTTETSTFNQSTSASKNVVHISTVGELQKALINVDKGTLKFVEEVISKEVSDQIRNIKQLPPEKQQSLDQSIINAIKLFEANQLQKEILLKEKEIAELEREKNIKTPPLETQSVSIPVTARIFDGKDTKEIGENNIPYLDPSNIKKTTQGDSNNISRRNFIGIAAAGLAGSLLIKSIGASQENSTNSTSETNEYLKRAIRGELKPNEEITKN
jgi:hypothetical protein